MKDGIERWLTRLLALALILSAIGVVYIAVTPEETTDPYTEFYVLGPEGNASEYPTNLSVGETGTLIVGITNHEHENMVYTVVLKLEDRTLTTRTVTVGNEKTWEREFSFTPKSEGRKRLKILLYRDNDAKTSGAAYRNLRLWINVSA